MSPEPAPSARPTSERRAAAARANGAKSRRAVTAQGRANSSRNSRRHGLRSHVTLFTDPASLADLADRIEIFERDFAPQSPIEHKLVTTMAVADWRRTCLFKLEIATPDLQARACESLHDRMSFLNALYKLDSRSERQYCAALTSLTENRAFLRECAESSNPEKVKWNERTQQATENTAPHSYRRLSASIGG